MQKSAVFFVSSKVYQPLYKLITMTTQPTSLQNLIALTNRGRRARGEVPRTRVIAPAQPSAAPTTVNPLTSPSPTCVPKRVQVKPMPSVVTRLTYEDRRRLSELARRREAQLPLAEVEEIFFTIYSTEEIKAVAVTQVVNGLSSGPGSVYDPQMGPTDHSMVCSTCCRDFLECPGHPGYIELPEPILHPLLIRTVIMVLNSVCNNCGGLLISPDEIREKGLHRTTGPARLAAIEKASIGMSCRHDRKEGDRPCLRNPSFKTNKSIETNQIIYEYVAEGEKKENSLTAQEVLEILDTISLEDAALLGYANGAHPRRMIMEVLMVIPPVARPPEEGDGKYRDSSLTGMYIDIIRHVNALRDALNAVQGKTSDESSRQKGERKKPRSDVIEKLRADLFIRIKHFINNTDGWYSVNKKPYVSITELVQGKEGLVRKNMSGKRVDFSARTVLSPDPSLAFGQISVPKWMAPVMTPRVRVNRYNRAELQNLLEKGRITYITFKEKTEGEEGKTPQAQLAGTRLQVTEKYKSTYTLRDGDSVERWLQDGDIVIFNRQPTLHKYSFMGYRAVLRDQKTFGLHISYTTPLNADFDGDEGNIHVIQVLDARAEAEQLMSVRNCLINAQSNKPTMGIVFNGPIAAMLMTRPETIVSPGDFFDALSYMTHREHLATLEARMEKYNIPYVTPVQVGTRHFVVRDGNQITLVLHEDRWAIPQRDPETGVILNHEYPDPTEVQEEPVLENHFTGRALFSALLPEDLVYEGSNGVIIQEGVLTNGIITRAHIGPERGSIIHVMAMNYPIGRITDFLTDASYILDRWLSEYGYSIGISSCLIEDPEFNKQVQKQIDRARKLIAAMGAQPEDPLEVERWEEQILAYVGGPADAITKKLQQTLPKDNALNIATLSGAKGKISNLIQIAVFVGQQHIGGTRPKAQMTYETRCLPWFRPGEETLESRGFCTASFLSGLTPSQMYFHQQAAREGLMGTAVTTADTGFMHRKAVKTFQDVKTSYDGSVRNVDKTIFEYVYGDDGFAPDRLQMVKTKKGAFLSFIDVKNVADQLNARYGF